MLDFNWNILMRANHYLYCTNQQGRVLVPLKYMTL